MKNTSYKAKNIKAFSFVVFDVGLSGRRWKANGTK